MRSTHSIARWKGLGSYFWFEGAAGAWRANMRMQPDRFAREILAILERDTMRSRRLMREALDGSHYHFLRCLFLVGILLAVCGECSKVSGLIRSTRR